MNLDYTIGDHSIHYFANYISEVKSFDYKGDTEESGYFMVKDYMTHNLSYNYQMPWSNAITIGVTNLTDEAPRCNKFDRYDDSLYSIRGRTYYMSFRQDF